VIDLSGKRALVTGGSRGIGAATARLLARAGAHVLIGYRSRREDAERVAAELRAHGATAAAHAADISTRAGAESLVEATLQALGGLDLFVGNAGVWPAEEVPLADMEDERWMRTMRENVDSLFYTTRAVARVISDHGRIVLVSSTAGQRGEAYHADYGTSKGAVISLTKSLAVELAHRDVTVNSVAPGWVDTEMVAGALAGDVRARVDAAIPLGRIASADDVAGPIVFLCSPLARHITGEILNVNGGSVLCG
jgi:3-oxoacyl-[acyl-carrier protein] reductase